MMRDENPCLIELIGLNLFYGTFHALKEIDLRLPPGPIGLLGPNGAGKSSLLKILMGLITPTTGQGRVLNQPLTSGRLDGANWSLRQQIGFMPEADALIPGLKGVDYVTLAGELCGMPRKQAQRRAHEVLTYVELEDARYRPVEDYSTGMKQRAKLAQALVHDPPLLLLDEPTSGLDPAGRDAMLRLLLELGRDHGKSFVLSTHLLADVETVCERVVILYAGQVRGNGTVPELCARRQDRYRLQLEGDLAAFREELQSEGVTVLHALDAEDWRVVVPAGFVTQAFFQLADNTGVVIRGLERDDETLEELFLRTVRPRDAS